MSAGSLGFYSYRDPSVDTTLSAYSASADWVLANRFSDQDIDEAKVRVCVCVCVRPCAPGVAVAGRVGGRHGRMPYWWG